MRRGAGSSQLEAQLEMFAYAIYVAKITAFRLKLPPYCRGGKSCSKPRTIGAARGFTVLRTQTAFL